MVMHMLNCPWCIIYIAVAELVDVSLSPPSQVDGETRRWLHFSLQVRIEIYRTVKSTSKSRFHEISTKNEFKKNTTYKNRKVIKARMNYWKYLAINNNVRTAIWENTVKQKLFSSNLNLKKDSVVIVFYQKKLWILMCEC